MAASKAEQRSERVAYWSGHITDWQRSGLSQGAYCRQHALSQSSLIYWRKRLRSTVDKEAVPAVTIVPVPLPSLSLATPGMQEPMLVHVGGNFRIEIRGDFAAAVFEKLVRTLARL